jgi:putative DNA primase/helicase
MQQRASHKKWAVNSGNSTRLHNMLGEVRPYVETRIEALDANPYLLCVENCTLDLQGGIRRRRHTPADLLTRCAPVSYDPEAGCPVFRAFLQRILPDPEEQMFLQRWLGYGLTGDISEQKLLLCHGEGRNGKSTLLKALVHVFGPGEYAVMLPFESILQNDKKRGSEASPDLARLPGARLVAATEPESNARLSSGMIKRMTGGEPITARDLNKGFFDFVPQFKMILLFNDKPTMPAQDEGTWRRIMMLDFKEMISDAEKDRHLDDKLAAEKNGILNWLLDGYRLWLERGVAPPPSVLAATQEYRDENDAIGRFLNETVTVMAGEYVTAKELMAALKKWCEDSGLRPISQRRLGDRMKQLGFAKDMGGKDKTYRYLNLKLLSPSPSGNSGYSREFL